MDDHERQEERNPLAPFAGIELDRVTAERILEQSRTLLTHAAMLAGAPSAPPPWRTWLVRSVAGLAACLVLGLLGLLLLHESAGTAFARVQERVARTRSVEFYAWHESRPELKTFVRVPEAGKYREDKPAGDYLVADLERHRFLAVRPQIKRAGLFVGLAPHLQENVYECIRRLPKDAVPTLAPKNIDGRLAHGYRTRLAKNDTAANEFTVWVDHETLLPVRVESALIQNAKQQYRQVYSQIQFDKEYDPKLFELTAPKGYALRTIGIDRLLEGPADPALTAPELKLGIGIGELHFGTPSNRAMEILGKPDIIKREPTRLHYFSRGYSLHFNRSGLSGIVCLSSEAMLFNVRTFQGKTSAGIGMGSTEEEVRKAYGLPAETRAQAFIYPNLGLELELTRGRVTRMVLTRAPEAKKAVKHMDEPNR